MRTVGLGMVKDSEEQQKALLSELETLRAENEALRVENETLKKDNAFLKKKMKGKKRGSII